MTWDCLAWQTTFIIERTVLKLGGFKTGENLLFEFEGILPLLKVFHGRRRQADPLAFHG